MLRDGSPTWRNYAIARFDCWSMPEIGILQQCLAFLAPTLWRFGLRRTELGIAYVWMEISYACRWGVASIRQHSSTFTNQTSFTKVKEHLHVLR